MGYNKVFRTEDLEAVYFQILYFSHLLFLKCCQLIHTLRPRDGAFERFCV